jgi:LmbE family N-acetylglucosaminyl deacetylase
LGDVARLMNPFGIALRPSGNRLKLVCIGAHSDDLEIGCGGTILRWLAEYEDVDVVWVVASAQGERLKEAKASANSLLRRASSVRAVFGDFRDAYFPNEFARLKAFLADARTLVEPDIVLSHHLDDRHQDHRLVAELTWQLWRNHVVLEYEIPKYDADLGHPNVFVPLEAKTVGRKLRHLQTHFRSQHGKPWFRPETFSSLLTLRGLECNSPSGFAEAFHVRKLVL